VIAGVYKLDKHFGEVVDFLTIGDLFLLEIRFTFCSVFLEPTMLL